MIPEIAIGAAEKGSGPTLAVHASAVAIGEAGILIRGPSGCGKSSLARDLIFAAGFKHCFASLVGDDRIDLACCGGRLVARGHHRVLGMIEQRGLGIIHVPHEAAVVARLVVDIVAPQAAVRFPDPEHNFIALCGVQLPLLTFLQGAPPYDCAVSVLAYLQRAGTI